MRKVFGLVGILVGLVFGLPGCVSRAACPAGQLDAPARVPRFVVVRTDYGSSALALLDADAQLLDEDWVDSGTRVSSLVTSISGDVVVPSTPLGGVAWLDRYAVDVLTVARLDGSIEAQIDLLAAALSHDGFTSNPHDALRLADGRILVSRHNPNLNPDASELSRGDDVIVIDEGHVVAAIDLHADVAQIRARPDVLLPVSSGARSGVLVTLAQLDARYETAGPGAALVLDEMLEPSLPVTFGALENCGAAALDPTDPSRAYVLCAGLLYATEDERRAHSGILELTFSEAGTLDVTGMAMADATSGVPTNGLIALGGRRVLAVAAGQVLPREPDRLLVIDVAAGTSREVLRTHAAAFALGDGTFDVAHDIALVPDAESSAILRIDASTATLIDEIEIGGCLGLPPREIGPL